MCLAGCSSDSGSSTAQQGSGSGTSSGAGTTNGGASSTCRPFVIESETVATTPGARTRTRIGIGEEVDLTTNPSTSVTWTIESDDGQKGTLSRASGNSTQYEACDRSKTVTIKAESACGRSDTHVFTVVEPASAGFGTSTDISTLTTSAANVGFRAPPAVGPADVSFYNCEMREGVCNATAVGVFSHWNNLQHQDTGSWVAFSSTVGTNGTELSGNDTVRTGQLSRPTLNGTTSGTHQFLWPIPWRAQVQGGGTNGAIVFDTANHDATFDPSAQNLRMEKAGASANRNV